MIDLGEFGKPKYKGILLAFKMTMTATIDRGEGPEKKHWETTSMEELLRQIRKMDPDVEKYLTPILDKIEIGEQAK